MSVPSQCANCKAPLPAGQTDSRYCADCTAAWTRGQSATDDGGIVDEATIPAARQCANCKTAIPANAPVDTRYCADCTAAWTRG